MSYASLYTPFFVEYTCGPTYHTIDLCWIVTADLATYDRVKRLLLNKTSLSDNSITHALARCALVTCVVDKAASVGLSLATSCSGVDMQRLATCTWQLVSCL